MKSSLMLEADRRIYRPVMMMNLVVVGDFFSFRCLWCFVSFGLFGGALIQLSSRTGAAGNCALLISCIVCALFGLTLARLADLQERLNTSPPAPTEEEDDQEISHRPDDQASPPPPVVLYCTICMESKPLEESFFVSPRCSHSFCLSCVSQYVATKVLENSLTIRCPDPDCRCGLVELETCRPVIPPHVIDRWERAMCESVIRDKFYCPFRDCSAVLADERGGDPAAIRESECPHCHRLFCACCLVPWHAGVSCEEYKKLAQDERGSEDLMLVSMARANRWQRCPKCNFFVERTQGCMYIKCRCDFKFCYGCASEMKQGHYCTKCKR